MINEKWKINGQWKMKNVKCSSLVKSPLRLLVRTQFQVLFHSPPGVLLTFPSRYLFSIDHVIYLALEGGPPRFSQGFTCPDLLDNRVCFRYADKSVYREQALCKYKVDETWRTGLSPSLAQLSNCFCSPRQFLTLCRLMVAPAASCGFWRLSKWKMSAPTQGCLQCHNPLFTFVYQLIRLNE